MTENNLYSNLSLEELQLKQKDLTKRKNIYVVVAILLVLNTLYAIYLKDIGMFHSISILAALFFIGFNSGKLKKVEEEIKNRKA